MLHSHHTKLNWLELAWNRRYDSCYDDCGDVYSRSPSLTTPLTPIPTLFLTITLSRSHPSIVQIICCERVLTRVASTRSDLGTARATGAQNAARSLLERYGAAGRRGTAYVLSRPRRRGTARRAVCGSHVIFTLHNINVDLIIYIRHWCKVSIVSVCVCVCVCVCVKVK